MAEEHNMRRVTAIKNGTVIDHIPSGQALKYSNCSTFQQTHPSQYPWL